MHFHLPKPLHGWREFAGEVGIIVIGVLIALGAEQLVESVHDRNVAQETRASLTAEFDDALASLALRNSVEPCVDRRLDELRVIMNDWERTGHFDRPQWVAQSPSMEIALARYDAAQSAGRLALLPSEEQFRLGSLAAELKEFGAMQEREHDAWGRLRLLQAGADALSPGDRPMLRAALQDASMLNYRVKLSIAQQLPQAMSYGFRPDLTNFYRTRNRILKGSGFRPSICLPIDTPPSVGNQNQVVPLPA